jgi:hypothetical protein
MLSEAKHLGPSKYKGDELVQPKRLNSITYSSNSHERSIELQARID